MQLTTSQFTDAFVRHIDESKPDPLAKSQMETLLISWEEQEQLLDDGVDDGRGDAVAKTSSLRGTLTLSSEYIAVSIHVQCHWKKYNQTDHKSDKRVCERRDNDNDGDVAAAAAAKQFQEELFIKLTASAIESKLRAKDDAKIQNRNDRKASKKLRAEMLKRLRSDHYIQRLFVDKKANTDADSALLCEALIQQNLRSDDKGGGTTNIDELEERVNVEEGTLQGIKNAIFSKSEDNLDVLEILLNMPYLPRTSPPPSSDNEKGDENAINQWPTKLADRAYLRLLEDAMFDACEKEGEDELLDDLKISETNQYRHTEAESDEEGRSRNVSPTKRMRNNP